MAAFKESLSPVSLISLGAIAAISTIQVIPARFTPARIAELQPVASQSVPSATANFVSSAVERTGSAVVRIDSSRSARGNSMSGRAVRGVGSGFVTRSDGLILTNAHVVDQANRVAVTLKDGRQFKGRVIGEDRQADVAVVKIQAANLPTVVLGNSAQLRPGEWAIAIGNPLGLDNTVTVGIVSATERSGRPFGTPTGQGYIQTDAAINPGNSGGPLLNQRGQVIGINTAIIRGAQGIGFAIPIDRAQQIAQRIVSNPVANLITP
jgi:serine protease Do